MKEQGKNIMPASATQGGHNKAGQLLYSHRPRPPFVGVSPRNSHKGLCPFSPLRDWPKTL